MTHRSGSGLQCVGTVTFTAGDAVGGILKHIVSRPLTSPDPLYSKITWEPRNVMKANNGDLLPTVCQRRGPHVYMEGVLMLGWRLDKG